MIEFKTPSPEDVEIMKEFASVIDAGMTIALKPAMAHVAHDVLKSLQVALFWFSHGVLNKQPVSPEPAAATSQTPITDALEAVASVVTEVEDAA